MKITVDFEDFYMNEDSDSIENELKKHITGCVVVEIEKRIHGKIEEEITRVVKSHVENILLKKISAKVAELIELGEIHPNRCKDPVTISDYIKNTFEQNQGWSSPYEHVAKIAKQWGDELKNRYDKAFAVHIVDQMKKNGLLKDEALAKLLE